ncbi:DUF4376 domain-containing protein [Salmonella enterica subsp. enterica serovar Oranienburg]|uniref:DUF4376 domain-containing protein n=1 Tax=Salmonella enterica TaxID=28901 RepID=A0A743TQW1_SALER|nr:DUF4376 domain-containing protein [Salmonella enterica]EBV1274189.1 DUF4376 domain-containing protein [Salmonella enterica subsp. enterica serovar Oranienburg]EDM1359879.1 hypothetical protein [Salmonella enterica subsp. enterica serovar Newport]EBY8946389.1 DUF4376 domain-containing protein [Salmonella enterica subsp. enterica serovar Oranienburg]EKK0135935.1 DUF4376 domain-containing protein [Salmonella enterica]
MTVITDAKNARYGDNGTITADVRFDDLTAPDGTPLYLPYTSTAQDSADFGPQLYSDLKSGKYGPVQPFIATSEMIQFAKDQKHAEINAWRNTQENLSYIFQFNNHEWDYGKDTQERLSLSVQMAKQNKLPGGFIWTDADNNDVPVSAGELLNLSDAIDQMMFKKGLEIHLRQRQMKEEVDALTDYQAIKDYVVDWPEGS